MRVVAAIKPEMCCGIKDCNRIKIENRKTETKVSKKMFASLGN